MAAQIAAQLGKLGFKGADIASATPSLANATGWYVDITGTTAITAFGTVEPAGQPFLVRFTGALTLTHHATSLILPGATNITTAAGDHALMVSLGGGNWRCAVFYRAAGVAAVGPATTTDNTVPRFNGTAGALQTSGLTISDTDDLAVGGTVIAQGNIGSEAGVYSDQAGVANFGSNTNGGSMRLRPNGIALSTNQTSISTAGDMAVAGDIAANSDAVLKYDVEDLDEGERSPWFLRSMRGGIDPFGRAIAHWFRRARLRRSATRTGFLDEEGIRSLLRGSGPCCGRRSRRW